MTPPTFPTELLEAARRRHQRVSDLLQTILEAAAELDQIGITVTGLSDDGSVITAEAEHPTSRPGAVPASELASLLNRGTAYAVRGTLQIDDASPSTFVAISGPAVTVAQEIAEHQHARDLGRETSAIRPASEDAEAAGADGSPASGAPSQAAPAPAAPAVSPPDLHLLPDPPPAADEPEGDGPSCERCGEQPAATCECDEPAPADADELERAAERAAAGQEHDEPPIGVACPECGDGSGDCCAGGIATPGAAELASYSPGAQAVYKALEQVAGNWRTSAQLTTFCQISPSATTRALAWLVENGIVQHNGRKRVGSAYRRPARRGGPAPEPTPDPLGAIVPGAEPAPEPPPAAEAKTTAKRPIPTSAGDTHAAILDTIAGAPLTVPELEHGLGIARGTANEAISYLVRTNQAQIAKVPRRDGFPAFEATGGKSAA